MIKMIDKEIFGETLWKHLNGESSYAYDSMWWEFTYDEPYPYTREEWEREIKGKSLYDLMPKTRYMGEDDRCS